MLLLSLWEVEPCFHGVCLVMAQCWHNTFRCWSSQSSLIHGQTRLPATGSGASSDNGGQHQQQRVVLLFLIKVILHVDRRHNEAVYAEALQQAQQEGSKAQDDAVAQARKV